MPYEHIEEIQSRKGEKIALFLTLENAMGLILSAFPAYLATAALPATARIVLVLLAAALGVLLTLEVGGMAGYERIVWRARGALRLRVQPSLIRPEQLSGAAHLVQHDRPLAVGGPIQLRPRDVTRRGPHGVREAARLSSNRDVTNEPLPDTSALKPMSVIREDEATDVLL